MPKLEGVKDEQDEANGEGEGLDVRMEASKGQKCVFSLSFSSFHFGFSSS